MSLGLLWQGTGREDQLFKLQELSVYRFKSIEDLLKCDSCEQTVQFQIRLLDCWRSSLIGRSVYVDWILSEIAKMLLPVLSLLCETWGASVRVESLLEVMLQLASPGVGLRVHALGLGLECWSVTVRCYQWSTCYSIWDTLRVAAYLSYFMIMVVMVVETTVRSQVT